MGSTRAKYETDIRAKLEDLRLSVRAMWHEVRYVIEAKCDRPGHLQKRGRPLPDDVLARSAGTSSRRLAPLLRALVDAELLARNDDGVLYSPELCGLCAYRAGNVLRAERLRRQKALFAPQVTPSVTPGVRPARAPRALGARPPPAPSPSPPLTPPLTPPNTPSAGAAPQVPAEPAGRGKPAATKKPSSKKRRTAEDHRTFYELKDWWCDHCWPLEHGGEKYDWEASEEKGRLNYRALWNILDALVWNVDHVRQAMAYFSWWCASNFAHFSVPLEQLVRHRRKDTRDWLKDAQVYGTGGNLKIGGSAAARSDDGNGNGPGRGIFVRGVYKPSAAERGEFPEPDEPLPEFGRDDDASGAAVAG